MAIYDGLPRAVPEDMGMSTSRLARVTPVMQGYVDNGKIPCALTMIARGVGSSILKNLVCRISPPPNP